ncbi:MAG: hypothetical protein AAFR65_09915 [Pseudomonadota bacterium]
MKLASRFGAVFLGLFVLLFVLLFVVRAVDEFDLMAAAVIWTTIGLSLSAMLIVAGRPKIKKRDDDLEDAVIGRELGMD